jgi:hypothetical protein
MNMKNLIILLAFFTCINLYAQAPMSEKKAGHVYYISIPDYMLKTYDLNDVATLQYKNAAKEAYTIVIEDSKEQLEALGIKYADAEDFLKGFVEEYNIDAKKRKLSSVKNYEANGNKCAQVELTWQDENNNDLYMLITIVETKTHYYKIMSWTLGKFKNNFKNDYVAIAKSLRD